MWKRGSCQIAAALRKGRNERKRRLNETGKERVHDDLLGTEPGCMSSPGSKSAFNSRLLEPEQTAHHINKTFVLLPKSMSSIVLLRCNKKDRQRAADESVGKTGTGGGECDLCAVSALHIHTTPVSLLERLRGPSEEPAWAGSFKWIRRCCFTGRAGQAKQNTTPRT